MEDIVLVIFILVAIFLEGMNLVLYIEFLDSVSYVKDIYKKANDYRVYVDNKLLILDRDGPYPTGLSVSSTLLFAISLTFVLISIMLLFFYLERSYELQYSSLLILFILCILSIASKIVFIYFMDKRWTIPNKMYNKYVLSDHDKNTLITSCVFNGLIMFSIIMLSVLRIMKSNIVKESMVSLNV